MTPPETTAQTVLITGAASGIGYYLGKEFANQGHSLILVAPDVAELNAMAEEIGREYGISVLTIATDLAEESSAQAIYTELATKGKRVDILVNNAGIGRRGKFWEITPYDDISMLRVNIEALVRLTRLFLLPMLERRSGRIMNTASVAGFEPGPNLAIYHATKAFVLSFSESLAAELAGTGVTLMTVCPGHTDSDCVSKATMGDTSRFQAENLTAPQAMAREAYAALMGGERVFVPGALSRVGSSGLVEKALTCER